MNLRNSKRFLLFGGVSASCFALLLHSTLCEARSGHEETCSIDDPLGQIDYDVKERKSVGDPHNPVTSYSSAAYRANRPIEDRFDTFFSPKGDAYVAVFDGHGGWQAAEFVKENLISNTYEEIRAAEKNKTEMDDTAIIKSLIRGFERTDRDLLVQVRQSFEVGFGQVARVGSCGLLVYLHDKKMYVANAGDVRAVVGRSNGGRAMKAAALSNDHNAKIPREKKRLALDHPGEDDIVVCKHPEACYVKGRLQPTRSFGDFYLKHSEFNGPEYVDGDRSRGRHVPAPYTPPYITATPEVQVFDLSESDNFIIIGSDGVWDFLENDEAVNIVTAEIKAGNQRYASQALVEAVLTKAAERSGMTLQELVGLPAGRDRRRRHDDTTAVVVYLN